MISENRIDKIISEEISKADVENIVSRKINSEYSSRDFDKAVRKVVTDTVEDLFKTLWNRSSSWKGGLKR